ncbi:MAG: Hpt domain-containing protein [Lachnospiraceae bacterium]|nr:Hpt domain-containing protein [Lachnospiraceae bacterium]
MQVSDLTNYGFDVASAMELCIDDEEIYKEVLEAFLEEGREKIPLFNELIANNDTDRYIIEVHGLKNAAKQVGATKLSDEAKDSELSGKEGKLDYIKEKNPMLVNLYQETLDVIAQLF